MFGLLLCGDRTIGCMVYAGIVNKGWKPRDYAARLVICQ
jgi:hypothetical protein